MSGKIRNAYMIREEGVGWSKKVHDLGKRKDILEAMTTFNKKKCWTRFGLALRILSPPAKERLIPISGEVPSTASILVMKMMATMES